MFDSDAQFLTTFAEKKIGLARVLRVEHKDGKTIPICDTEETHNKLDPRSRNSGESKIDIEKIVKLVLKEIEHQIKQSNQNPLTEIRLADIWSTLAYLTESRSMLGSVNTTGDNSLIVAGRGAATIVLASITGSDEIDFDTDLQDRSLIRKMSIANVIYIGDGTNETSKRNLDLFGKTTGVKPNGVLVALNSNSKRINEDGNGYAVRPGGSIAINSDSTIAINGVEFSRNDLLKISALIKQ